MRQNSLNKIWWLLVMALGVGGPVFGQSSEPVAQVEPSAKPIEIEVYRSATCGCCGKWMAHLVDNQFKVNEHVVDDLQELKKRYGVPSELASCHTAIVNGYVVEGHVPAQDIFKLLKTKPKVAGITVPGMPVGTPGMEMGDQKDSYQVMSFDNKNPPQVFSQY